MDQETQKTLQKILEKLEGIEERVARMEEENTLIKGKVFRADLQLEQIQHDTNLCIMALGANNTLWFINEIWIGYFFLDIY